MADAEMFWMIMGDKKKAKEYMTLLEQDQKKCNSIPSKVDLLSSSSAGDDTVVSGGDINMKDTSYDLDEGNGEDDNISSGAFRLNVGSFSALCDNLQTDDFLQHALCSEVLSIGRIFSFYRSSSFL